jgi:hypothetical protein
LLAVLTLVAFVVGACSGQLPDPLAPAALLTVEMRGGMCPEGECRSTVRLLGDGRVETTAKPPTVLGVASVDQVTALQAAIAAADFADLTSRPFTGECPVNFDGQELIFTFSTATGQERLASCEVEIDYGHPLFVAVGVAMGPFVPLPLM